MGLQGVMTGNPGKLPTKAGVLFGVALGVIVAAATPSAAEAKAPRHAAAKAAAPVAPTVTSELQRSGDRDLLGVYAGREYRPLWTAADGSPDPAVARLLGLIETAAIDGVDPGSVHVDEARAALGQLAQDTSPRAVARAELALSRSLVALVQAMTTAPASAMIYEHPSLRPGQRSRADILWVAANAPSLAEYVVTTSWMHPLYTELRATALTGGAAANPTVRDNLVRLRALPAVAKGKSLVVDAASARLLMFDNGRLVDTMKVVVGKPDQATPLMAGYVRHAIVNPYWNVPDDLVQGKIAANVAKRGAGYLTAARYEVLSGWTPDATLVSPSSVDWRKVASGELLQRVRQLPGAANAMGKVKFEFPNPQGIYLHDTPDKQLMLKDQRQLSSGCVRLEDADRLGRWLLGTSIPGSTTPETKVLLPELVPIHITYLTARVEGGQVAFAPDPYKLDGVARPALAQQAGASPAAR